MFTQTLRLPERQALLSLAIRLVHIDGDFHDAESARLRALRREMALPLDTELPDEPIDDLPEPFTSPGARQRVILVLLQVAAADDFFHPDEKTFIETVAQRLDIAVPQLEAMIVWTRQHNQLVKAADVFLR